MNTLSSGNLIRHKASPDMFCKLDNPVNLFHPREDNNGNYYVSSHAGEILQFNENGNIKVVVTIGGQPNCVCFDGNDALYYADLAHATVFYKQLNMSGGDSKEHSNDQSDEKCLCKEYDGTPLKGPTSLAYNKEDDLLFFTDSGSFGTTTINRPNGSLFVCEINSDISRPLLLNCLSCPSDLIIDCVRSIIYVCETFTNRIIRVIQKDGIYNSSIFYQFSGRVGPTAIAIDDAIGNIYIARYEFQNDENDVDGCISVLNKEGMLIGELMIPKLPEITGLLIPSKNKDLLYFTEKNSNGIFKVKLSTFVNEMEKLDDNNKLI